ncbi:membrane protein [Arthrobacter phage Iter]|uniref:Uncharacterized protein n=1 Tax=Arthrobacter phage Ascela TaxID=3038360 RepID=A0AAF0GMB2_9CAUD|nr:membrane protein [Arthrobacter phage Iter]WGH21561.1 hypothetical protein SEA_ASCELA_38 [Arthrobacter phage Ascela]
MHEVVEPQTGALPVVPATAAEDAEGTFVLLPVLGEPEAPVALFQDGSYTRWIPAMKRKTLGARTWLFSGGVIGGLAFADSLASLPGL